MKVIRNIIEIDEELCDGCGQCAIACAEGAIEIINGKAKLVSESYCDGLGACLGECPQGAIRIVEREAEDFDPEAVHHHLASKKSEKDSPVVGKQTVEATLPCGCPSTTVRVLRGSPVRNWPLKIRLVSPEAPFFKTSRLFVVADCAPASCPNFHEKFLDPAEGGVLVIGCPKFDALNEYRQKLASILRLNPSITDLTVIRMEVPCCSGLAGVVNKAVEDVGRNINVDEIVLSAKGEVIRKMPAVAVA
ncbi:MAG: ATP-binding protein [Thermodesulforhabdaceae bacterium]